MTNKEILAEAQRVIDAEISSLELCKSNLDNNFVKALSIIIEAPKLIVTGVGKSGIIGKKIAGTFSSISKPSIFLHPVEALHGDIGMVSAGDAVLILSKSGSTEEIVRLVPFLKSRNTKLISIVGNTKSYLAKESDVVLNGYVEKEACPLNIAPTSSCIVALAIGDALASCYMKVKKLNIQDFSRQHPLGQLGRNLTLKVKDVMHQNSALAYVYTNATFRDALIEITNKGLGCVCIVDKQMHLKGIITDGDVRRTLQRNSNIDNLLCIDVMTKNPVVVKPDELLGDALTLMSNRTSQISVLPVVDENNKCIGIIRVHDIIRSGL